MKQHPAWLLTGLLLFFIWVLVEFGQRDPIPVSPGEPMHALELPILDEAGYDRIAAGIFMNETGGRVENLTHWGEGEDFPSFGIGHFIWFPEGVDSPFDEQFPAMVEFVSQRATENLQPPAWLRELEPLDAPWKSKQVFEEARSSTQMRELRDWLDSTRRYQAIFIVHKFTQRINNIPISIDNKRYYYDLIRGIARTPEGLFALIDYYNFKGLGSNERERYQGEGWGLLQVLEAMPPPASRPLACDDSLVRFRQAAAERLRLRVELSPPEREETRWLKGWMRRLDGYLENPSMLGRVSGCGFRVRPYLQNPAEDAITINWIGNLPDKGQLTVWKQGEAKPVALLNSKSVLAEALYYHPAEACAGSYCEERRLPYFHQVRVSGLEPGNAYRYEVTLARATATGSFSTPGPAMNSLRIIVYADSETEPESTGKHANWPSEDPALNPRRYPVDQTQGYAANLAVIEERRPDFVAIAGDLVESGGEQRDWDEFWRQNESLAAKAPIMPALGNHDYYAGPGALGGYSTEDTQRAIDKYRSYFDLPENGEAHPNHAKRFYVLRYGPVSLIALDLTDGQPHRSDRDTNWFMRGKNDGGHAPGWHEGSAQYAWLEDALRRAQDSSAFTFVMFHSVPYTSGVHGQPPGQGSGKDPYSSLPVRALTPLFMKYGVDAVFNGHDEMYERSVLSGVETFGNDGQRPHQVHFLDVGIAGDGLRAPYPGVENPHRVFLAHVDSPEIFDTKGVLVEGGKHYGHLEISLEKQPEGHWTARFEPVYLFPVMNGTGEFERFERRIYDDRFSLTSE